VKAATIGIRTLANYSVGLKDRQQLPKASSLLARPGLHLATYGVSDFLQNTVESPSHCG
jgi:hypothetical protein